MTNSITTQGEDVRWLTRDEGIDLTVALGRSHVGDDYYNADVFGGVMHFGGNGSIASKRAKDPETFDAMVVDQIEAVKEIVEPYVGMYAMAVQRQLGLRTANGWELWKTIYPNFEHMHTSGVIIGAAGVALERVMWLRGRDHSEAIEMTSFGRVFKIGVLFDTSETKPEFSIGVSAPNVDQTLVPVRGFPGSKKYYHGIWSWQIRGKQR